MPEKKAVKQDLSFVSYTLGVISIVMAFFQPLAGFILGMIGFIQSNKQTNELSKKAKKLNMIGMILGIILLIISILVAIYLTENSSVFSNFPVA